MEIKYRQVQVKVGNSVYSVSKDWGYEMDRHKAFKNTKLITETETRAVLHNVRELVDAQSHRTINCITCLGLSEFIKASLIDKFWVQEHKE